MLGSFLHICTCTCTIYCGLWPPDNTSCYCLTWYQSPGLGLIFSDAQLVRDFFSSFFRPPPPAPAAAAFPLSPLLDHRRRFSSFTGGGPPVDARLAQLPRSVSSPSSICIGRPRPGPIAAGPRPHASLLVVLLVPAPVDPPSRELLVLFPAPHRCWHLLSAPSDRIGPAAPAARALLLPPGPPGIGPLRWELAGLCSNSPPDGLRPSL
jgi:hypothetical protein